MRVARLLPAAICTHFPGSDHAALRLWADEHGVLIIQDSDVRRFETISASLLKEVARARLPLADAEDAQIAIFAPAMAAPNILPLLSSNGDTMDSPACADTFTMHCR